MGIRRRGRERAVECLYQWESTSSRAPLDRILARFWKARSAPVEVHRFAERLVRGTVARIDEIDPLIAAQATNWRLDRMSSVDRNILRLGVYELMAEDEGAPPAVVIDEAIELAKRYSGEQAGQFVNGVLDGIRKRLEARESEDPAGQEEAETVHDSNEATG